MSNTKKSNNPDPTDAFASVLFEHSRLGILRCIHEMPRYMSNHLVIRDALDCIGIVRTRDQVKTDIAWLCEQGLVTTENVKDAVVVILTERGADVATGRANQPGVARPGA